MEYRKFVDSVCEDLNEMAEFKKLDIGTKQVEKLQGQSYYGISVQAGSFGFCVDLAQIYSGSNEGEDYATALLDVEYEIKKAMLKKPDMDTDLLFDYESAKKTLMVQVVPTAGNEEMLAKIPHFEWEDISAVYRMVLSNNEEGSATVLVTNEMLDIYGVTAEQLKTDALANSEKAFPAKIRSMNEVISEMLGVEIEEDPSGMYVASSNNGMHGAGCILYSDFAEKAFERLGGDFYVIPSSVHEVILLPDNGFMTADDIRAMVGDVNDNVVAEEDRLSYSVYKYDGDKRELKKCEV